MLRRFAIYGLPLGAMLFAACGKNANLELGPDGGSGGANSSGTGSAGTSTGSAASSSQGSTSNASTSAAGGGDAASSSGSGTTDTVSVLQYHKHVNRDGFYVDSAFTEAALMGATLHLDPSFDGTGMVTGAQVRASPLYAEKGYGGNPSFYVADESDNVYAFNGTNGKLEASVNLGTGATGEPCTNPATHIGIRGTPAIDEASGMMVLDALTGSGATAKHTIWGIPISTLSKTTGAWSVDVSTVTDPVVGAFVSSNENQRGGVLIVGGIAYVVYGGYIGDCGDYHGWVIGVPVTGPTASSPVKEWASPSEDTGIWAPGGASSDGVNVYVATGNPPIGRTATNDTNYGVYSYSLIRFQAGPVFSGAGPVFSTTTSDYWLAVRPGCAVGPTGTPPNVDGGQECDFDTQDGNTDEDLGGSGPLIVNPPSGGTDVVQLGKDGDEWVLDATKALGGAVSPSVGMLKVMSSDITGGPASASVGGTQYVAMVGNGTSGVGCAKGSGVLAVTSLDPANAATPIASVWCANPGGGGSPIITTSDGTHDAMVWTAGTTTANDGTGGDNQLHAFALNGSGSVAAGEAVLAGSDTFANVRHFTSPIVVNGRILVAGDARLYAYKP